MVKALDLYDFQETDIDEKDYPERLTEFAKYMETMKGSSYNTIKSYSRDIAIFLRFLKVKKGLAKKGTAFHDIKINDITDDFYNKITLEDMYSFLIFCKKYFNNGSSTIARKIASLRAFNKYLHLKVKIIDHDYSIELDRPKIGSINLSSIKDDTIKIIGKGNKERTIYLNDACLSAINNYLKVRNKLVAEKKLDTDALFLSERGNRIARRSVQEIIEKQLKNAGLSGKGYSTHKLRHTSATLMYKYGDVDILVLKEILGHEDVSTTQIYTHLDNDMLREAVKVNPLNNKKHK